MAIFVPNNSGTVTFTNGSNAITGTGTLFTGYRAGSVISIPGLGEMQLAADPTSDTAAVGTVAWQGATAADKAFQYLPRNEEGVFTDKLTQLLSALGNGNMQALAGLTLSASKVLVGTGPGALGLADRSEFVNGVRFNARVPDEAGIAAYATKPGPTEDEPGYTVLIEAYGVPPRAVLVSKASDTSGDWTGPAYVEGDVGPLPEVTVGAVVTGDPGTAAIVSATPTMDGVELDFTIPAGAGFYEAGVYNGANAYAKGDVTRLNGSSFIALQAVPAGEGPSAVYPPADTAYWAVLAMKGQNGAGTVAGVAAGAGAAVDDTDPTVPVVSVVAFTGDSGAGGALGGVPAPAAGDAAANKFLKASGGWEAVVQVPAASAAEVAAGTEAAKYVAPATLKSGAGVTKAWLHGNGLGTVAILQSLNISGLADMGVGEYHPSFISPFADALYSPAMGGNSYHTITAPLSASTTRIFKFGSGHSAEDASLIDTHVQGALA